MISPTIHALIDSERGPYEWTLQSPGFGAGLIISGRNGVTLGTMNENGVGTSKNKGKIRRKPFKTVEEAGDWFAGTFQKGAG